MGWSNRFSFRLLGLLFLLRLLNDLSLLNWSFGLFNGLRSFNFLLHRFWLLNLWLFLHQLFLFRSRFFNRLLGGFLLFLFDLSLLSYLDFWNFLCFDLGLSFLNIGNFLFLLSGLFRFLLRLLDFFFLLFLDLRSLNNWHLFLFWLGSLLRSLRLLLFGRLLLLLLGSFIRLTDLFHGLLLLFDELDFFLRDSRFIGFRFFR